MNATLRTVWSTFFCFVLSAGTHADVINVPADAPTIQAGIDLAVDGDEVIIADGTYSGPGNRDISFEGKAITVRSANGAAECRVSVGGPHFGFKFESGESSSSRLVDITVTGVASYEFQNPRSACKCSGGASPVIERCVFSGNQALAAEGHVGVAASVEGSARFIECVFEGNNSAVASTSSGAIFERCRFEGNSASVFVGPGTQWALGGAFYGAGRFYECVFSGNWAQMSDTPGVGVSARGGAMYCWDSELIGCTFVGNSASVSGKFGDTGSGGAVHSEGFTTIDGCRFEGNTAGFGAALAASSDLVGNSLFCANTPDHISGTYTDLGGNIFAKACPACPPDLDASGDVGFGDVLLVLAAWGPCGGCPQDLDDDGNVGFSDLLIVLAEWGSCF